LKDTNRYRVSRDFTFVLILAGPALLVTLANLINDILNRSITIRSGIILTTASIAITTSIFYFSTRNTIEYDDTNKVLYVVNSRNQPESQIPLKNIDKILFSIIGLGRGSYSYIIIYNDHKHSKQSIRLFPTPLSKDIDKIINDTKVENPNVIIRNRSLGVNEFFD
jgi:hypothetical protein